MERRSSRRLGSSGMAVGDGLRPFSERRAAEMKAESPVRQAFMRYERKCQFKALGGFAVPPCFGELHIHEPWTRGGGGPTDDPRNMAVSCDFHNGWCQQSSEGREFAYANGLLVHDYEGEAWLRAGGRFPGKTAEQALEHIGIRPVEEA